MKKIALFFLAVVAGITAVSCVREELAVYDDSQAVAPVINSFTVNDDGDVSVTFTPGIMGQSFNEKMPVNHSLVLLKADDKEANRVLTSSVDGNVITLTNRSLSRGLATLGYVDGDVVKSVSISLRASLQEQARDNGLNGFMESAERVTLADVLVVLPQDSPYKEYTKLSDWTLIGSIPAYEISWDKDLVMWTDGQHNHVAAHVTLGKDDEVKFRKDKAWDVNLGGEFGGLDSEFDVAQDGANIKVGAEGVYDIFFNDETKKAWVSEAFDPYPAYTKSSDWSVTGSLKNYEISWDDDIAMISDGTSHLALGVSLAKEDEFKFRKDKAWDVNLGGTFGELGAEFSVSQDGPNIKVGEEGDYDLLVNPEAGTAMVSEASGAKVSYVVKAEEPVEPEEKGWGIVGDFNGWANDVEMTEVEGIWTARFNNTAKEDGSNGAFKFRKNAGWDENLGAPGDKEPVEITLGEPIALAAGGKNFSAPAGLYEVVLDLTDEAAPTATFTSLDMYSLIGKINGSSWDTDFEMTGADGVYTSDVVYINGGFKIRHNMSWADENTYGAESADFVPTVGTAFTAAQPGKDITLAAGNYRVRFTLATLEVLITSVDYELPEIDLSQYTELPEMAGAETWGLIGPAQPGGWSTDTDLQKIQDEPEIWAVMNIALQGDKFKFRGNDEWADYDLGGGEFALNEPIVMTKGGGDMKVELGVYTVYLYPTYGVAYFTEGTGDVPLPPAKPELWSLIGTINGSSWDQDFDMTNTSGDKWEIKGVDIAESDEFKLRADHSWDANVGGPEGNDKSTLNPDDAYDVYKPVLGEAFAAGDKNIRIGVKGTYNITFDYAAMTITIRDAGSVVENMWGVVGTINGWGNDGPDVVMEEEGLFVVARNVALTTSDEIKIRFNNDWADNRGGKSVAGVPVKAVAGGDNIKVGADGNYDVYYRPDNEVLIVNQAGADLVYWGVVGTINGWGSDGPDHILYVNDDLKLQSDEFEITASDQFKIRQNEDWAVNRGGAFAALDEAFEVAQDGANIAPGRDGKVQVVYDAAAETITLKGEFTGDAPAFPENVYAVGADTDWSGTYLLVGGNGKYKGFGYLSGEFKFRPNADNWDGAWGTGGEGKIALGADNLPAPATAGYYMMDVDLNELTYNLTLISTIGIIGPAQAGGWDSDTDMTYNATDGTWEAKAVTLSAGDMKFRANDAWDINWGGSLDALTQGGDNIAVQAGTYDIVLYALCDGQAKATLTAVSAPVASGITIDGDFSDWANVTTGVAAESDEAALKEWKVAFDETYLYFYIKTDNREAMWNKGRYMYVNLDLDNDSTTGFTHDSVPGLEAYTYFYMYGGTSDAPAIIASPAGKIAIGTDSTSSFSLEENSCAGVITATVVETEVKLLRSAFDIKKGTTIGVNLWGNKGASDLKSQFVKVAIDK